MENTTSEESIYHVSMIIQPSSQDLFDKDDFDDEDDTLKLI